MERSDFAAFEANSLLRCVDERLQRVGTGRGSGHFFPLQVQRVVFSQIAADGQLRIGVNRGGHEADQAQGDIVMNALKYPPWGYIRRTAPSTDLPCFVRSSLNL